MKIEENAWSKGVVLICTKCAKSFVPGELLEDGNAGENLKMFLKKSFQVSGDLSKIRVVTSSCLDICEDNFQALSFAPTDGKTETFVVHPEKDREELLKYLREKIKD